MAPIKGSALYKKKDGTLAIAEHQASLSWTPVAPPGSEALLDLPINVITNLQQTPASSPKVMLKVFTQLPGSQQPETHVFTFTNPAVARSEADSIKDALSKAIHAAKAAPTGPAPGGNATSSAMTMATTITSRSGASDAQALYNDEKLLEDVDLQQALLKSNPQLSKTFMESLRTKPDSIKTVQFTKQFWSSRVQLLRAHAIEKAQTRGSYNVLSTIRPVTVDNSTKLSISKEQIQLIFRQHPLVKRVYDENVPNISEEAYWSRFFQSRLFKKLKGERITDNDPTDNLLDKYLSIDEDEDRARRAMAAHIPHIIDIEGNEENHSQRKGNMPDRFMRPTSVDKVPIIRTLNSLSEKILSHVKPSDVDPAVPIGVDEETFKELALRDLQGEAEEDRIILNVKDQSHFFHSDKDSDMSAEALQFAKADPVKVLSLLRSDLAGAASKDTNLATAIGVDDDSDSSDDDDDEEMVDSTNAEINAKGSHIGSKAALQAATAQMLAAIAQQRLRYSDSPSVADGSSSKIDTSGLSMPIFERLTLTHATTTEFLSHFWSAFLSGSASRAEEISKLVETLDRAMDRIRAVAEDAEREREVEVEKLRKAAVAYTERTGRKRKVDESAVPGGSAVVERLMRPTVKAIEVAGGEYRKALQEQSGASGVMEGGGGGGGGEAMVVS